MDEKEMTVVNEVTEKKISRRDFVIGAGKTALSIAVAGGATSLLSLYPTEASSNTSNSSQAFVWQDAQKDAPMYPFPYQKLDPEEAQARAYAAYKEKGGWGVGVAEGFFGLASEKYGYPFNQIPVDSFTAFAGGYGLATLCGSLGVCAQAIGTVVPKKDAPKLISELFEWYAQHPFPQYQPEYNGELKTTVSGSYICEDSVGNFMNEMKVNYKDPKRKARCAATAAETTKKMVELINAYYNL